MVSSGVDSGIAGTVSVHSDMSTAASSQTKETSVGPPPEGSSAAYFDRRRVGEDCGEDQQTVIAYEGDSDDYEALCDLAGDSATVNLSDEEYVAKFVLAEQICSTPMPSNPVMHKLTLLPKRRLFVGSYLFQAKRNSCRDRAMCAISLLGNFADWEWYTDRQRIIEEMFVDIIPRVIISYLMECIEDFVCRATGEISRMLSVLGVCEVYPLLLKSTGHDIRIRQTFFGDGQLQENAFLAKAITAVLVSQAHCIIVGDEKAAVAKLLLTLWMFVAPEWRWLCIRPYQHPYSPYLRLQAIQRIELANVMYAGAESHWPLALIDIDRRLVCTTSSYSKHRFLKLHKQKHDIALILQGIRVSPRDSGTPKIELRNCHADPRVKDFLAKMDLLPFETTTRMGFIKQFWLPDSSYKQNAMSSKWSLWSARKALDLTNNSTFLVTLAVAERMLPDITEFMCQSDAF
ncbi:unnamed protein product [Gongylonema pulchrum]|uniref:DUF5726 domain-containing protein n=1 Tax=Gongylonema pulchrum TaxID=637853 RepID=A0A183EA20_9BILA|nr:unnamed protein product [Gongylonema pulchrum]